MANTKTAGETEAGKYTEAQLEADGWVITLAEEPRTVNAGGGRALGAHTIVVEEGRWRAEKTVDDHLITAYADDKDGLLEAVRFQQASIDNAVKNSPTLPVLNDNAGDAGGEENVGIAGVLPELEVEKPAAVRQLEKEGVEA